MAGAGYKLFNTGDVLTAAQVNTYLMEQTVMVFADAAARTAALSGVVSEGMISYLKDTNAVEVYNGSAWVASDDPNAIQNTIVDAKGDLITATAADTPARLPVGNNGETLVADSSTSTGLRWNAPVASLANPVINGGMDFFQRSGTPTTGLAVTAGSTTFYGLDRWANYRAVSGATVSRQATGDTTNLPNIQNCLRIARDSGNTSTSEIWTVHSIETANSIPFAGKAVTLSFYARKGATFSPSTIKVALYSGTGTDQNYINSFTGSTVVVENTALSITTGWVRYVLNGTIASTANELAIGFFFTPSGTAGATDFLEITGVQLDVGTYTSSTAPTFRRSGGTLAGELAACQRYLPAINGLNVTSSGFSSSTTSSYINIPFQVTARVKPTGITVSSNSHFNLYSGSLASGTPTGIAYDGGSSQYQGVVVITTTAGSPTLTAGQGAILQANSASAAILFTGCEL